MLLSAVVLFSRRVAAHDMAECLSSLVDIAHHWKKPQSPLPRGATGVLDSTIHIVCLGHDGEQLGLLSVDVRNGVLENPRITPNAFVAFISGEKLEETSAERSPAETFRSLLSRDKIRYYSLLHLRRRDLAKALLGPIVGLVLVAALAGAAILLAFLRIRARYKGA